MIKINSEVNKLENRNKNNRGVQSDSFLKQKYPHSYFKNKTKIKHCTD